MAIVSSTKVVTDLGGGRFHMREKHTDSVGVIHEQTTILTSAGDADAVLAANAAAIDDALAQAEFEQEVGI